MKLSLAHEIDLPFQGGIPFAADLTGNGQADFLVLQSPGLFHARIHGAPAHPGWDHFCLTALDQAGQLLWQVGEPWASRAPYESHGAERSLAISDINGDGRPEVLVIRGSSLLYLEGASGRVIKQVQLPADNFVNVTPAKTGRGTRDWTILVKVSDLGHPGFSHGNPACFFDSSLALIDERSFWGSGHAPRSLDFDGDGLDEWIIGYNLIDVDRTVIWSANLGDRLEYDDLEMHSDGSDILVSADGRITGVVFAGSRFVYRVDARGNLKWKRELEHPQQCIAGNFMPGLTAPQIFVVNKRENLQLLDSDGGDLWIHTPTENWPLGKPDGVENKFHLFEPSIKIPGIGPRNTDAILYLEGGWPYGIDGSGCRFLELECPPSCAQNFDGSPQRRPDDWGYGYLVRHFEFGGTKRLMVADRDHIWIFVV